ncbi:MAG: LysM peptidoglycan-binding domain-containing protein [Chloroflexi bacterium]|nr:MAG: LysM peptidoglycan-binding domain-containing protein [Chloroflexota bacterium]
MKLRGHSQRTEQLLSVNSPESEQRYQLLAKYGVALVTTALLAAACSSEAKDNNELFLSDQDRAAACLSSDITTSDRRTESDSVFSNYATLNYSETVSTDELIQRHFPNTPLDIALQSLRASNGDNPAVTVNLSNMITAELPAGSRIDDITPEGIPLPAVECINGIQSGEQAGEAITVTLPVQAESTMRQVVVQQGDTYSGIAKTYNIDSNQITRASNNFIPADRLHAGDILQLGGTEMVAEIEVPADTEGFVKQHYAQFTKGLKDSTIPVEAVMAQAIVESGYGTSELALSANNLFGMKANSQWNGSIYEKLTKEHIRESDIAEYPNIQGDPLQLGNGMVEITIKADFKQFDTVEAGITEYAKNIATRSFNGTDLVYQKALDQTDPYRYVEEVASAGYATDVSYIQKVSAHVDAIRKSISEINRPVAAQTERLTTLSEITAEPVQPLTNYSPRELTTESRGDDGMPRDANRPERIKQTLDTIAAACKLLSIESFDTFRKQGITDISDEVMRDFASGFTSVAYYDTDGTLQNKSVAFNPKVINYFFLHYTATPSATASYDGRQAAQSSINGNEGTGYQYYINSTDSGNAAETFQLTKNLVNHTYKYSAESIGVEVAASGLHEATPAQISKAIMLASDFMLDSEKVTSSSTPDQIKSAVDATIVGHSEMTPDERSDWPKFAMDKLRQAVTLLLTEYTTAH